MMDRSAVKAIVDRELAPLLDRLGIAHWSVRVSYEPAAAADDGRLNLGTCNRLLDYHSALITLNPEAFADDDDAEVLATLRHELFHIVLSPFDLYTTAVDRVVKGPTRDLLDRVWDHAVEQAVVHLERMHRGLVLVQTRGPESAPKAKAKRKAKAR